jgi:hypothetical protein
MLGVNGRPRALQALRVIAALGVIVAIAGCSMISKRHQRPDDFAVKYARSTGVISSPNWSRYAVDIDAKGKKTIQSGSHNGDVNKTVQLSPAEYDSFYAALRSDGAFDDLSDNPPCPGPATGYEDLSFFANGNYVSIPLCSKSKKKQKKIDKVWQDVRAVVGQP